MITIVLFHVLRLAKEIEIAFHGARGHGRSFHQRRRRNGWFLRHRQATTLAGRPRSRHHCASWVGCTSGQIVWWRVPFVCLFASRISDRYILIHRDTFLEVENSFLSKSCQMETDIVGTLLAGSLVAQVGEDKAEHETVTAHLWSHMMSRDITWCPADSWEWNRTDVRGVDWAHFWDQRLGDQEPNLQQVVPFLSFFTWYMSEVRDVYQNQSLEMSAKQVNIKGSGFNSVETNSFWRNGRRFFRSSEMERIRSQAGNGLRLWTLLLRLSFYRHSPSLSCGYL